MGGKIMFELECGGFIFLIILLLIYGRRINPSRWKIIDANASYIINSNPGTIKKLKHIPEDVVKEYTRRLKGHKGAKLKYNPTTQVLELYKT